MTQVRLRYRKSNGHASWSVLFACAGNNLTSAFFAARIPIPFVKRWNWKCFSGFVGNRSPLEQLLIYILNIDSFIPSLSYYVIQSYSVCILFVAEKLKKNSLKKFIVGGQHLYWRATQILFHFCYFYLGMLSIFLRNNFHRHLSGLGLTSVRNFGMKCDLTLLLWKAF